MDGLDSREVLIRKLQDELLARDEQILRLTELLAKFQSGQVTITHVHENVKTKKPKKEK